MEIHQIGSWKLNAVGFSFGEIREKPVSNGFINFIRNGME